MQLHTGNIAILTSNARRALALVRVLEIVGNANTIILTRRGQTWRLGNKRIITNFIKGRIIYKENKGMETNQYIEFTSKIGMI